MTPEAARTARWVADRFALGRVLSMEWVARGAMGEVHRLVTDAGAYAVKRAFWREDPDDVVESRARSEVDFVERCLSAGIAAPRPVPTPDGRVVARDAAGTGWRVHGFAPGIVPDRADLAAEQWVLEQGALIHRLALEPAPGDTVHDFYTVSTTDWAELARQARADGTDWAPRLQARAGELADLGGWASSVPLGETVLCHRDLKADNTLRQPDGTRWLLDWDDVGAHDPAREVGTVLLHHVADPAALVTVAAAYGAAGGVRLPDGPELFASGVAVWLNFLAAQTGVLLDPDSDPSHREFAVQPVLGLLEIMPTFEVLERCGRVAAQAANRERRVRPRTMGP
ncbi:aminoglycoside phosphotransferase family protein [Terrabacter sp. LjRoot27]|uniref:phosphotransferase n=1 Tax=Terrabacter sp. LjRoot27 TaxID=3342306 RepID=UPI003ECE07BA